MTSVEIFIIGLVGFIVLLNLIASIWLLKDDDLERFQLGVQILIVWLLPLVGSILIISLQWSHRESSHKNAPASSNGGGYMAETGGGTGD